MPNIEEIKEQAAKGKSNDKETKSKDKSTRKDKKTSSSKSWNHREEKSNRVKTGQRNDPKWYVPSEQLAKDGASIPYAVYNGVEYGMLSSKGSASVYVQTGAQTTIASPGIFIYKYVPWYGNASTSSALNLAMRGIFSFIRAANSGRTNYEAPDLIMYIMQMDQIYLLIHEAVRLVKLANTYLLENRTVPVAIFKAMGIDYEDLVANQANYRTKLNTIISKVNSMAVPAALDIFKRRAMMGSVILTDEPNRPTQIIIPHIDGYFSFDATAPTGSTLRYKGYRGDGSADGNETYFQDGVENSSYANFSSDVITMQTILDNLSSVLDTIISDDDFNIMSGDIIKAYGSNLHQIQYVDENAVAEFTHDEDLLTQFANATVIDQPGATLYTVTRSKLAQSTRNSNGIVFRTTSINGQEVYSPTPIITQENNTLLAEACIVQWDTGSQGGSARLYDMGGTQLLCFRKALIRSFNGKTAPENTLENTRLTMGVLPDKYTIGVISNGPTDQGVSRKMFTLSCGTEIGLGWLVRTSGMDAYAKGASAIQWFQYGKDQQIMPENGSTGKPSTSGRGYIIASGTQQAVDTNGGFVNQSNYTVCSLAMVGLSFGPLYYALIQSQFTSTKAYYGFNLILYSTAEKTAMIDNSVLDTLHGIAILGLIKSPYIK